MYVLSKKAFFVSFIMLICFSVSVFSQTDKLAIVKTAKQVNKNIAVYFSGSDWCAICHVFNNEIVNQKEVSEILANDFVFYNADFPQRKKIAKDTAIINDLIAEKLNPNGVFPLLVIADENFNIKTVITRSMGCQKSIIVLKENTKKNATNQ